MFIKILAMLPLVLALPEVSVNWTDQKFQDLRVEVVASDTLLTKCLKSGLAMQYSYQVQLCRRRPAWFDSCLDPLREKQTLSYDPISGSYQIVSDRMGDVAGPEARHFTSLEDAREALSALDQVSLEAVGQSQAKFIQSDRAYLSVRVQSDCRGDYNRTLAKISSFLTLGLLRVSGFDTGWINFKLERAEAK